MSETEINFRNIRAWGSQQLAFEELCVQLASFEDKEDSRKKFIVKEGAGGDGGVECYWQIPNGDEIGWQAKYFCEAIDWQQIDDSVTTAIAKHPKLIKYIICLPKNLADSRKTGASGKPVKTEQDHWNDHETKWKTWAVAKDMNIEFILWNKSHLLKLLTTPYPEYQGRAHFWFNEAVFTKQWFETHIQVPKHI